MTVTLAKGAQFNNYGTFEEADDLSFSSVLQRSAFNNAGLFIKSGGSNGMSLSSAFLTNSGIIDLRRGTITAGDGANTGSLRCSVGATQSFAGNFSLGVGGVLEGPGVFQFLSGTFDAGSNDLAVA